MRRTWLYGESSERWAMVLSFAAYRQTLDTSLLVGSRLSADLHRYPGPSTRALVGTIHDGPSGDAAAPPALDIARWCDHVGQRAGRRAVGRSRCRHGARRADVDRRPVGADRRDRQPRRWLPTRPGLGTVVAASGGRPVPITVEWTVDGVVPLTVHLPDRVLDVGPRADPSFVSAA